MDMKINIDEAQSRVNIEKQSPDFAQLFLGNPARQMGTKNGRSNGIFLPAEKSLMINHHLLTMTITIILTRQI